MAISKGVVILMFSLLPSVFALDDAVDPMLMKLDPSDDDASPVPNVDKSVYGALTESKVSFLSDASMLMVSPELWFANLRLLNSSVFVSTTSLLRSASFVVIVFLSYRGRVVSVPS